MASEIQSISSSALSLRDRAARVSSVLPGLILQAEQVAASIVQGVHGRRRVGAGDSFWQYRQFQPGDTASQIDWRQSARKENLYIREMEWEAAQSLWFWCDSSPSMDFTSQKGGYQTKLEHAQVLTLALSMLLVRAGEFVGVVGDERNPGSSQACLDRIAEHLSNPSDVRSLNNLPQNQVLRKDAHTIWISDFLVPLDQVAQRIKAFSAMGIKGYMVQILDPAERDLPFSGRVKFSNPEDGSQWLIHDVQSARSEYIERLQSHLDGLKELARSVGWAIDFHRTDSPLQNMLLRAYARLGGQIKNGT